MTAVSGRVEPERPASEPLRAPAASLYEYVGARLRAMIPAFRLESDRATIERVYELLCRESLALPAGRRPLRASRLNADGTPFQFSLTLGRSRPSLQFVAETGPPSASNSERLRAALQGACDVAHLLGATDSFARTRELVDQAAPADDPAFIADHAGCAWVGAAFASGGVARLKVYVNASWGREDARWSRLSAFAESAELGPRWRSLEPLVRRELEPLGISVAVGRDAATTTRVYLRGYGTSFRYYERLAGVCGGPGFADHLRQYGRTLLGDDYRYPSRAVVCSLGAEAGSLVDFKFELCAHCVFDDDRRARARCLEWLRHTGIDPTLYLRVVDLLSSAVGGVAGTQVHAYVGIGTTRGRRYSTFYLNPGAKLP